MIGRRRSPKADTHRIQIAALLEAPASPPHEPGFSVVLYHRNGADSAHLRPGAPLLVGRAPPATVPRLAADDPSLSKTHARFFIEDGDVYVEDCQSTNGTWLHDNRIRRGRLSPGDMVRLGPAVFALLKGDPENVGGMQPIRHERFRCAVEDESLRARHFGRAFALVMIRAEQDGVHVSRFVDAVTAHLRPIDRFAFYSPGTVEVLLPEHPRDEAVAWTTRVLAAASTPLLAGVAGFSTSAAADPEELVAHCRAALREAHRGAPISAWDDAKPAKLRAAADTSGSPVIESPALQAVFERAKRIAPSTLSVLILGETGVGKEILARQIHNWSPRQKRTFLAMNCGAIPPSLLESTLFGHVRGAFTDAREAKAGIFEEADGGTLLLDEIGELPKEAQTRLLRVLEELEVVRLGANRGKRVDVRVLAATHCDLEAMVKKGAFREDLFYRLNRSVLHIPPLRERQVEIPALARHFLEREAMAVRKTVHDIAPAAMDCLIAYSWPGNIRELRNTIEQAVVLTLGEIVTADDLPDRVRAAAPRPSVHPPPLPAPPPRGKMLPRSFRDAVKVFEKQLLEDALGACGGDREAAAKRLRLPVRTLAYMMRRLGIQLRPRAKKGPRAAAE